MPAKRKVRVLGALIGAISVVGLFFVGQVFVRSMAPSDKAKAMRSTHDISGVAAGTYVYDDFKPSVDAPNMKVLIVRDFDSHMFVYLLPIVDGKVPLPESWWGWGMYHCADFRPDTHGDKNLVPTGVIRCQDQDPAEFGLDAWQWTYDGRSKTSWVADLYAPRFEVSGDFLYINN